MRWNYSCPHCHALLNPDQNIMLLAEYEGRRFLAGLHPQPGNYEVHLPPDVQLIAGERWSLFCPVCGEPLTTDLSDDLCALDMHTGADHHRVYFSRVVGEQATFVVTAEGMLSDYGIHTDRYLERLVHLKYMR